MQNAAAMRGVQRIGNLDGEAQGLAHRQRPGDWRTFDVLEDQIIGADVVDLADVRMVERRNRARFLIEALLMRVQRLHGDRAVKSRIPRLPDFAHAACANPGEDFIWTEASAGS